MEIKGQWIERTLNMAQPIRIKDQFDLTVLFYTIRANFTNSLCQCKPSFGIKTVQSGFTKDMQWRISAEKVIFVPDLIKYTFVGASLSDANVMGGEYSNESRQAFY